MKKENHNDSNFHRPMAPGDEASSETAWPEQTREHRPWAYQWWMGSAVDEENLKREFQRYREAGLGGVHIIPIYGACGAEARYIEYLSPRWMDMLHFAVTEAERLDLGVDMTTGTGWCFGGPNIHGDCADATLVGDLIELKEGENLAGRIFKNFQAVMAFGPNGETVDLMKELDPEGRSSWTAPADEWTVYGISQKAVRQVKRAAPGGAGPMINPAYAGSLAVYLARFDAAFDQHPGSMPRGQYHDSWEYGINWSPDLFAEFARRRGYRLETHLPLLFDRGDPECRARLKGDYRKTLSEMILEHFVQPWTQWAHGRGFVTRNQAHGSPGNLLDLYAAADIPETEMFWNDRESLISKMASSAAHLMGKPKVSSETGTWVTEHFHETLGDLKDLIDQLFAAGINHVFYHGTCYSPDDAAWPGWVFYAATQMNPRNAIWHDAPILNAYIARCQSFLQAMTPANDVLLYWPIADLWHHPDGLAMGLGVHDRKWLDEQPFGITARALWQKGYPFDFVSDRLLGHAQVKGDRVTMPGGDYRAVLVPPCRHMETETMDKLMDLACAGATVIFQGGLPVEVPGLGTGEDGRARLAAWTGRIARNDRRPVQETRLGKGCVMVCRSPEEGLQAAGIEPESVVDGDGVEFIRGRHPEGYVYFIAHRGKDRPPLNQWVRLATAAVGAVIFDPMTGRSGVARVRAVDGRTEVFLQLHPGQSLILRTYQERQPSGEEWVYLVDAVQPVPLTGPWSVEFISGGPELPPGYSVNTTEPWTSRPDPEFERFGGTAVYRTRFETPAQKTDFWRLDLGKVAESARLRLNGHSIGAVIGAPVFVDFPALLLREGENELEIEVTSLSANRIRDLDRRHVAWKSFHDINFVNITYRSFDASTWPVRPCGLIGPVYLWPRLRLNSPESERRADDPGVAPRC